MKKDEQAKKPKRAKSILDPYGSWIPTDPGSKRRAVRVAATLGVILLTGLIAWAATANWGFDTATNYELSDSNRIEITGGGLLQLKAQYPFWRHDTQAEFDAGTHSDTEFINLGTANN